MNNETSPDPAPLRRLVGQFCLLCADSPFHKDRKCAFADGVFNSENWNCGTANALRDLVQDPIWHEDQNLGVLRFPDQGRYIIISWYKSSGCTESITMNYGKDNGPLTLKGANVMLGLEKISYGDVEFLGLPNARDHRAGPDDPSKTEQAIVAGSGASTLLGDGPC